MGANDVTINIRTRGGRQSARDADQVSSSVGRLGRRAEGAGKGLRLFSRGTASATGGMRLLAGVTATGGAALGGALLIGLKRTTDAWQESRKVAADTHAVLKSTGGVANVTARDVDRLTAALSRRAGVDDEAIQSGENVLLTFTRVRNEVGRGNRIFDRATQTAVDMSARFGQDLRSSFVQVGKALDDPVKGVTALRRIGVSFTKSQIAQIKTLEATGDHLGAQRLILRALDTQVKGSSTAQATPLDRLKVSWGNIEETIGKGVSPAVDTVAEKLDRFLVRIQPRVDAFGKRMGSIVSDPNLTGAEKFNLISADMRQTFRPYAKQFGDAMREAQIGRRVGEAIEAGAPYIGEAMGRAAPVAARSFLTAFRESGPWGQALTMGFLLAKFGPAFSGGATLLSAVFGRKFRGGLATQAAPGGPMAATGGRLGTAIGAAAGITAAAAVGVAIGEEIDKWAKTQGFTANRPGSAAREQYGKTTGIVEPWVRRNVPGANALYRGVLDRGSSGRPRTPARNTGGPFGGRAQPVVPFPARGASQRPIHTHVHLNGREIGQAVHREARDAAARRRGAG